MNYYYELLLPTKIIETVIQQKNGFILLIIIMLGDW